MIQQCPDDLDAINKLTGLVFKIIRENAELELAEVANYLEVSPERLEAHEAGRIPLSTARLYHAGVLLGVKISAFFQPYYHPELFEDSEDSRSEPD